MTVPDLVHVTIRPRRPEDDPEILAIYHQYEDVFVLSLDGWRFHLERPRSEGEQPEVHVAEVNGRVVGDSYLEPRPGSPGVYFVHVEVHPAFTSRGIGTQLWTHLEASLRARHAIKVYSEMSEDRPKSEGFARAHGFEQTGRTHRVSRLTVRDANMSGWEDLQRKLRDEGVTISSVADLGGANEALLKGLYSVWEAARRDIPRSEAVTPTPFDTWRHIVLYAPGRSPEQTWVALDGSRPIGVCNLHCERADHATNGLTGVVPEFRGRGVATALKHRSILWARAHGIDFIDTDNDAENQAMLAINVRLGYKPLPGRVEWLKQY